MRMDEPQTAERAPAERIHVERGDEDTVRVSDDDMRNTALAGNEHADLLAEFMRQRCEIAAKFVRNDGIWRNAAAVDLFEQVERAFLETGYVAVDSAYGSASSCLIIAELVRKEKRSKLKYWENQIYQPPHNLIFLLPILICLFVLDKRRAAAR